MRAGPEFDLAVRGAVGGRDAVARVRLPGGAGPFASVLLVHGYTIPPDWGFWPELARRLGARGIASARVAFSGDGLGPDLRTVEDLGAVARNTYVAELDDLAALAAALRARPELDAGRRALVGHSRGGGMGIVHAAEDGGYRAVAVWAAFDGILQFSAARLAAWRERGRIDVLHHGLGRRIELPLEVLESAEQNRARLDVLAACRRLGCPALVVHGTRDRSLPPEVGQRIAAAAGAELCLIEGAGHAFGARDPLVEVPERLERLLRTTVDWLAARLGPGGGVARARQERGSP